MMGLMMATIAAKNGAFTKKKKKAKSMLSASNVGIGANGMPKIKRKRLVDSPAPASNGYSRTLG